MHFFFPELTTLNIWFLAIVSIFCGFSKSEKSHLASFGFRVKRICQPEINIVFFFVLLFPDVKMTDF